jgi:hypothetical protein
VLSHNPQVVLPTALRRLQCFFHHPPELTELNPIGGNFVHVFV